MGDEVVKVFDKAGTSVKGPFLKAPPTKNDEIVGKASTQALTNKTLTTPVHTLDVEAVAAAGSVQGDATAIAKGSGSLIHGTGGDGTKGIKLPAAAAGKYYFIKNGAGAVLKVYPATGDQINAIAVDGAISMAANTAAVFVALDATTWFTFSLLPS